MKNLSNKPYPFIPLTPAVFHVLLALSRGDQYGYRIMQMVEEDTQGQFGMSSSSLYGTLKRMLNNGLIEISSYLPDPAEKNEHRRYYRLTWLGKKISQAEAKRLDNLVSKAREFHLLQPAAEQAEVK
ncbi:MAG: PadR family transcriptional regulator [Anaerolineaceae bacterium]|nr:PadR family transcriptional regulator [Anaerolineaceae bacterium]